MGILTNIAKVPLGSSGEPDPKLALNMVKCDWYQVPFWGLIDKVVMMMPQKVLQVSVGYRNPKAVQVARFPLVIIFKGSNKDAEDLVWQALTCGSHGFCAIHDG